MRSLAAKAVFCCCGSRYGSPRALVGTQQQEGLSQLIHPSFTQEDAEVILFRPHNTGGSARAGCTSAGYGKRKSERWEPFKWGVKKVSVKISSAALCVMVMFMSTANQRCIMPSDCLEVHLNMPANFCHFLHATFKMRQFVILSHQFFIHQLSGHKWHSAASRHVGVYGALKWDRKVKEKEEAENCFFIKTGRCWTEKRLS